MPGTTVRSGVFSVLVASAALSAGLLLALAATKPAEAAFPGENGRIAFTSGRDGNGEIYTMNPDGTDQRRITNDPGSDYKPTWSADGDRIAFVSDRAGGVSQIFVMNADGSEVRQVTRGTKPSLSPAWSPNGKKIVLHRYVDARSKNDLFVVNTDGTGGVRLTKDASSDYDPNWSPDGKRIVYGWYSSRGIGAVCTISPTGSDRFCFQKNDDSSGSRDPDFSPDGKEVVFERSFTSDDQSYILAARTDGRGSPRTIRTGAYYPEDPVFSPDGRKVAFEDEVIPDGEPAPSTIQIFTANSADGSGYRQLTTDSQGENVDADWQSLP